MDEQNTTNQDAMPPKQSPFKTVTAGGAPAAASGDAPKTIVLRRPTLRRPGDAPAAVTPAAPASVPASAPAAEPPKAAPIPARPVPAATPVAQGIAIPHGEAVKKMTSRISVSSATSPIPSATSLIAPVDGAAKPEATVQAAKKMTSRITLESALGTQPDLASPQPKTIRLKRPSEAAAAPVAPAVPPAPASVPEGMTPIADAAPAQGADSAEDSPTRRKTIKVKRPGAPASGPKISIANNGAPSVDGVASASDNLQSLSGFSAASNASAGKPDKVNPFFIVAACLAIVVGSVLVWVLTSQTYGSRGAAGDYAFPKGPVIPPPPGLTVVD